MGGVRRSYCETLGSIWKKDVAAPVLHRALASVILFSHRGAEGRAVCERLWARLGGCIMGARACSRSPITGATLMDRRS
eukprot:3304950-Pyramimonas_sp.AAC.1